MTDEVITMAHGAGGKASQALTDAVFRSAYGGDELDRLDDGAVLDIPDGKSVVFTTDAFVVTPRRFPGGSIGDLAVNGTVNDLAVMGATPTWLSVAVVLEEGLPLAELREVVADVAAAAAAANVTVVAGDTKVVERGAADGCYFTTSGIGLRDKTVSLGAENVQPGDAVIISGTFGDHGMSIMLARGDLDIHADLSSDTASIHQATAALLAAVPETRWMRDPTRGGVASACNELAVAALRPDAARELNRAAPQRGLDTQGPTRERDRCRPPEPIEEQPALLSLDLARDQRVIACTRER